jgi:hypothetical protein
MPDVKMRAENKSPSTGEALGAFMCQLACGYWTCDANSSTLEMERCFSSRAMIHVLSIERKPCSG